MSSAAPQPLRPKPRAAPTTAWSIAPGKASYSPDAHIVTWWQPRSPTERAIQSSSTCITFSTCGSPSITTRSNDEPDFPSALRKARRSSAPATSSSIEPATRRGVEGHRTRRRSWRSPPLGRTPTGPHRCRPTGQCRPSPHLRSPAPACQAGGRATTGSAAGARAQAPTAPPVTSPRWASTMTTSPRCGRRPTSCRSSPSTRRCGASAGSGQGLCPFHAEKTPSFSVNPNDNVFYCFGCQAKGDVIAFVLEKEQLDFPGAVEWLAAQGRHQPALHRPQRGRGPQAAGPLHRDDGAGPSSGTTSGCCPGPDAGAARRYLRARGLDGDVVREFRIGWAPDAWDELTRALRLDDELAEGTGLARAQQPGPAQRPLPGPHPVPDLRRPGRPHQLRRPHPARAARARATRASTRTRPRRRSTTSPRCSTGSTGPRRTSSPPARP